MEYFFKKTGRPPESQEWETPKRTTKKKSYITSPLKTDVTLRTILEKFFVPVLQGLYLQLADRAADELQASVTNSPDALYQALETLFNVPNRKIDHFYVKRNITNMPGEYYIADGLSAPYGPKKLFRRGHQMMIAYQKDRPDDITVEIFKSWKSDESWKYRLDKQQLASIMEFIEPIERVKARWRKQRQLRNKKYQANKKEK